MNLTECLKLAASRRSRSRPPLTRTGASNSPRCRRPSVDVTERPSAIRNTGTRFHAALEGQVFTVSSFTIVTVSTAWCCGA